MAVRAVNYSGSSTIATVTATPLGPAPENLVAAPDKGRVVLQWDTGGSEITNYLVRSQAVGSSGDPAEKAVAPGSGTRTTTEVTGLTNGTEYVFSVRAAEVSGSETVVTGMGASVTETPAVAVPAAPVNLTATAGNGQVAVTWDNPGNITIRKYQYSTDGSSSFNHMNGSKRNTTSFTFSNLTNGTEYTLAIRASNLSGESTAATVTATPLGPAPENLVAALDSTRVVLQWDTGDSEVTNYLVRTELTSNSWDIGEKFVTASAGPRTTTDVTSLTDGTEYSFYVQAAELREGHTQYTGPASIVITGASSSLNATPAVAVPAAPTGLTATTGDGQVAVTWDNPGNITIRKYQYSTDGGSSFNHMNGSKRNTTSFTFNNLTNGTDYTLAIRASNLSGESTATTVTATPLGPAPTGLSAVTDSRRVILLWDTGGSEITNYLVRSQVVGSSGNPDEMEVAAGSGAKTRADVTGLTNGTEYVFTVHIAEVSGTDTVATSRGVSVTATPAASVPSKPTGLSVATRSGEIELTWNNPADITIRKYQYTTNGGNNFTDISGSNANTTSYTITGLSNGTQYTVGVRAVNDSGVSSSATKTATAGWPAPTNLVATPGDRRVTLEWDRGDSAIANYVIRQGVTGSGSFSNTILSAGNGATRSFTVINLTNGTEYTFMVGAGGVRLGQHRDIHRPDSHRDRPRRRRRQPSNVPRRAGARRGTA